MRGQVLRQFGFGLILCILVLLASCGTNTAISNSPVSNIPTTTVVVQANTSTGVIPKTPTVLATGASTTSAASTTSTNTTSAASTTSASTTQAVSATAAINTTSAAGSTQLTPESGQFVNPVINQDFPDPGILKVGDTYYVYATNSAQENIQEAKSTDLVHWQILKDALPTLPSWSEKGHTWAPGVTLTADGKSYVMYFVARQTSSSKQCIGVATSTNPEGPFESSATEPFICQLDQGGSIDPSAFIDTDGTRYVVWKNDGNCCNQDTYIYLQKVSANGQSLLGQPTQLIHEDQGWEGKLVEAPVLWKHNGKYDLFYSANNYAGADYAIGYALADNILGPYTKPDKPLAATVPSRDGVPAIIGPGGEDIVVAKDGTTWMLYHSWDPSISYREMNIDQLTWDGDKPVLHGPMDTPEKLP